MEKELRSFGFDANEPFRQTTGLRREDRTGPAYEGVHVMQQYEVGDPRRTGVLPVREHLRPKPCANMDYNARVWLRDDKGQFYFNQAPLEDADALEVLGEA